MQKRTIYVSRDEYQALQGYLDGKDFVEDVGRDDVIKTFTVDFGGGLEVDIKVCNGDGPYVDAVLFLDGHEVEVLEPSDELLGEYPFNYNGDSYTVDIQVKVAETKAKKVVKKKK
jgi:hypothetical protein